VTAIAAPCPVNLYRRALSSPKAREHASSGAQSRRRFRSDVADKSAWSALLRGSEHRDAEAEKGQTDEVDNQISEHDALPLHAFERMRGVRLIRS
jgi:hypothetical protein